MLVNNLRLSTVVAALAVLALALTACGDGEGGGAKGRILPLDSSVEGETYSELALRWEQWLLSIPSDRNPSTDPDGRYCQEGQTGQVFFLGTNFGGTSVRSCTVPSDKTLLVSPGGAFCILHISGDTGPQLKTCVEDGLSEVTVLQLEIDGAAVPDVRSFRIVTPLLSITLPEDNVLDLLAGEQQLVAGHWFLLISSLEEGEHVIHMHVEFAPDFVSDVTYNLTISR